MKKEILEIEFLFYLLKKHTVLHLKIDGVIYNHNNIYDYNDELIFFVVDKNYSINTKAIKIS
ncbi:MAG: hypothetical protein PHD03_04840 [Bacilli bacterium]|nr:hypothetical protein [Bacilli bacterium]